MGITMGLVMAGSTVVLIKMTIVEWVCLGVRDGWDLRGSMIVRGEFGHCWILQLISKAVEDAIEIEITVINITLRVISVTIYVVLWHVLNNWILVAIRVVGLRAVCSL